MNPEYTIELGELLVAGGIGTLVMGWIAWFWGVVMGKRANGNALIMKDEFFMHLGLCLVQDHILESFDSRKVNFSIFGLANLANKHQLRVYRYGNVVAILDQYNERLYIPYTTPDDDRVYNSPLLLNFHKGKAEFTTSRIEQIAQLADDFKKGRKIPVNFEPVPAHVMAA